MQQHNNTVIQQHNNTTFNKQNSVCDADFYLFCDIYKKKYKIFKTAVWGLKLSNLITF